MCGDCPPFVSLLRAVIAYLCKTIPVAKEEARWKETFCETSPISPNTHTKLRSPRPTEWDTYEKIQSAELHGGFLRMNGSHASGRSTDSIKNDEDPTPPAPINLNRLLVKDSLRTPGGVREGQIQTQWKQVKYVRYLTQGKGQREQKVTMAVAATPLALLSEQKNQCIHHIDIKVGLPHTLAKTLQNKIWEIKIMNTKASNMSGYTLLCQNHAARHRLLNVVCLSAFFYIF